MATKPAPGFKKALSKDMAFDKKNMAKAPPAKKAAIGKDLAMDKNMAAGFKRGGKVKK